MGSRVGADSETVTSEAMAPSSPAGSTHSTACPNQIHSRDSILALISPRGYRTWESSFRSSTHLPLDGILAARGSLLAPLARWCHTHGGCANTAQCAKQLHEQQSGYADHRQGSSARSYPATVVAGAWHR